MEGRLRNVYDRLLAAYGPQGWWPGDDDPFVVVVGAVLAQSTAWRNVDAALRNLRRAGLLTPDAVLAVSEEELARLIRPAGYFNVKARRLRGFVEMLTERFDGSLSRLFALPTASLRETLLSTYGIGPETADDILLYAAGRPVFVVDAYTRRIFSRLELRPAHDTYAGWQALFMGALPADAALFNEYHALLVEHAKVACRKLPLCSRCPLLSICPTGAADVRGTEQPARRKRPRA